MNDSRSSYSALPFRKVAVVGAGTMGAQIAAHFANAGLEVELLDIAAPEGPKNAIVEGAFKRAGKLRPAPLFTAKTAKRIRLGNLDEHMDRLADAEWIVEAVVERLDIKQSLFEKIEAVASDTAIISTNTSGIPIASITSDKSASFRRRFLGTHFFNPPRYLKLLEVIPGADTDPDIVARISEYARVHLGKGVVVAKDSPYFIGNRIGIFALLLAMSERSEHGFSMEEVDTLTGELVGHPRSATFRTADVVGLDVMKAVIDNLGAAIENDESKALFTVPAELEKLVEQGSLGAKTRAGYYQKVDGEIRSWDPSDEEYKSAPELDLPSLSEIKASGGLVSRLRALFHDETKVGDSFRRTTLGLLAYAARRIPEITDSPASIDQAIKWGFGWKMGPFEIWDALGIDEVRDRMKELDLSLPDWAAEMDPETGFYQVVGDVPSIYDPEDASFTALSLARDEASYFAATRVITETDSTLLRHFSDDVAILEFRSKANTLGAGVIGDILEALSTVEANPDLRGLVIANSGSNFSVGANLGEVGQALLAGEFEEIGRAVQNFQKAMEAVHNSLKPVVVACHSRVLGGATELVMSSRSPLAAAESYMGLVELGVGLIPAGTGCLRLMENASRAAPSGHPSEILSLLQKRFQQVAMARVSSSAQDAKDMGYLRESAPIVMREERRFFAAAAEVVRLSDQGYAPPVDDGQVHALGAPGRAAFESMAYQFHQGRFISDYDLLLAKKLAYVMTGGDLLGDGLISRSHVLDLEREAFMSLLGEKNTQARIRSLLETGKPLRN